MKLLNSLKTTSNDTLQPPCRHLAFGLPAFLQSIVTKANLLSPEQISLVILPGFVVRFAAGFRSEGLLT
jgi:hypothetical protein